MTDTPSVETHSFQSEVQQLLQLMIHSLYSNKEVFLRELISNASDACDKLRFSSLTDESLLEGGAELGIWVEFDSKKKTVTVRDNGIGMDRDEVIANIGTIARSGTRAFLEQMNQDKQAEKGKGGGENAFIGQFGVGFYSSFLVADEVTLLTRKAGLDASAGVKWVSDGSGEYTLQPTDRPQQGTEIILKIKKQDKEYLDRYRIRSVITKYSDHISLPIQMFKEPEKDDNGKPIKDQQPQWETINKGSALWARARNAISEQEHQNFYTALTYDPEPPAVTLHNRVEGKLEYISLFYIPAKAPYDLWDREQRHGIKLYVRRIFIADDARQLMPNYLRFVRGLVDSADLPLNVSREFLQKNPQIDKIRAASVKKILSELKKIAVKDAEKYQALWREYGRVIKEGMVEEPENQETVAQLLRFASTHNADDSQTVSLDDYIERMSSKQKVIYYITADSFAAAGSSPHLEVFRKNNVEVLLLSDPVDEWVTNALRNYRDKPLQSIARGELDLNVLAGKDDNSESKKQEETLQPLVDKFKSILENKVKDVKISGRLVSSPACLVADEHDMGANMERILQAMGQEMPETKPILEINPEHAIIQQIQLLEEDNVEAWAHVLFDQAALAEGASLTDPGAYVNRVNKLLVG